MICPFINNGEEAKRLVEACRYPHRLGFAATGPRRAGMYFHDVDEYCSKPRTTSLLISPIIESREAIDKIDDIMSVDGIDAAAVGPVDLSISLGIPMKYDDPKYRCCRAEGSRSLPQARQGHGNGGCL